MARPINTRAALPNSLRFSGGPTQRPVYLSKEWHALKAAEAAAAAKPNNARRALRPSTYLKTQYVDERRAIIEWLDEHAAAGRIRALGWHVCRLDDLTRGIRTRLLRGRLHSIAAVWVKGRGWRRAPARVALWLSPTTPNLPAVTAKRLHASPLNRTANITQALASLTSGCPKAAAGPKKVPGTRLEAALLRFWTESAEIWVRRTSAMDGRVGAPIARPATQEGKRASDPSPGPWAENGWSTGRRL